MKRLYIALLTIAAMFTLPGAATASVIDMVRDYNAIVFNDFTGIGSDVEGRLAVGGNANLTNYGVGNKLAPGTTGDVLSVGGSFTGTNGQVYYSDATVGGAANLTSFTVQGSLHENTTPSFDFAAVEAEMKNLSSSLAALEANGTTTYQYGGTYLHGSSQDLVVFTVGGDELGDSWGLVLDGIDAASTIIINISDPIIDLAYMGFDTLKNYSDRIIFNFFEAESLNLAGLTLYGTVLAPYSTITGGSGSIYGGLVASSFDGSIELEYNPFNGEIPTSVPEPGSFVLLALGLTGIALFASRKRASQN